MRFPLRSLDANKVAAPLLLVIALFLFVAAFDFPRASGLFPKLTGGLFILLCAIETLRSLRAVATPATTAGPAGLAWLAGLLATAWLAGFLLAVPLFITAFVYFRAGWPMWRAVAFAIAVTALLAGLFAGLLNHRLYAGLLFAAGQG